MSTLGSRDLRPNVPVRAGGGAGDIYFPLRLRCTSVRDLLASPDLEDGVASALGRAFARARTALPSEVALGHGVALQPPRLVAGDLAQDDAAQLLARIERAIRRAAQLQALPLAPAPTSRGQAAPSPEAARVETDSEPLSEPFDPKRFHPTRATYDVPSYRGGRRRVPLRFTRDPFRRLYPLYQALLTAVLGLRVYLEGIRDPNSNRRERMRALEWEYNDIANEQEATRTLADVLMGKRRFADLPARQQGIVRLLVHHYLVHDRPFPARARLAERAAQLRRGLLLVELVRGQVVALDRLADAAPPSAAALRETLMDLGSYYLELLVFRHQERAFARLAFLTTFYRDPSRVEAYAVARAVRERLPELWQNLKAVSYTPHQSFLLGPLLPHGRGIPSGYRLYRLDPRELTLVDAAQRASWLLDRTDAYGDLPKDQGAVKRVPGPSDAGLMAADLTRIQGEIAVLALWQPIDQLSDLVSSDINPDEDWRHKLRALNDEFAAEVRHPPGPGFAQRCRDWERRVKTLSHDIVSSARWHAAIASVIQSIPLLIVGGAVADGVGVWAARVTEGSRWLIALSQGVALTAVNLFVAPPGSVKRPGSLEGWIGQLAINVLLARVAPFMSQAGEDASQWVARTRLGFLSTEVRWAVGGVTAVGMAASQTAMTALVRRVTRQHAESGLTQVFTINVILNLLALVIGESLRQKGPDGAILPRDPETLARVADIREDAARAWVDLAGRTGDFLHRLQEIDGLLQSGRTAEAEAQFGQWRQAALDLLDELEQKLPLLNEILDTGPGRAHILARLDEMRTLLRNATVQTRLLLPENVPGLRELGTTDNWGYDPRHPPAKLAELEQSYRSRGYEVLQLPGGGWEAEVAATGETVLRALPAPPEVAGLLPPSLEEVARGPMARAGVTAVEAQTEVVQLQAQLAEATVRSGRRTVNRLLRLVSRVTPADTAAWHGLSAYLAAGGDPAILARALSYRADPAFAAEHADTLLRDMAKWDESAFRGLQALYRVRPRTTSEELRNLLSTFEPQHAEGFFQSIDVLANRSEGLGRVLGPVLRDPALANRAQERGAQGVLASAVQLAERFPEARLRFEVRVPDGRGGVLRVQDIVMTLPGETKAAIAYEVKEVTADSLGTRRVARELARDILLDQRARQEQPGKELFSTFRWRIRRAELARRAAHSLGITDTTDPRVDAEMRRMVANRLRRAFDDPSLHSLSPTVLDAYRNAFDHGLPFVEFF